MDEAVTLEERDRALRAIIDSPYMFAVALLGLEPFPYQRKFLEDTSKRILVCAGRQSGKSYITAARTLWFAIAHPDTNSLIVSSTLKQSSLMFDKIAKYVDSSSLLTASVVRKTRTQIVFTNGSEIHALPCGPAGDSLRGYTAHQIIIDEAAFVPEDVITTVVMPMLSTTDGTAILISTPYDKDHYFFRAFCSQDWSRHQFKTSDNPRVTKEFLEQQRVEAGEQRFRQEYLAEFVDDDTTYFPMPLLRSCVHVCGDPGRCEYCSITSGNAEPSGSLFAGYDPGGEKDPAALVVVERNVDQASRELSYRTVLLRSYLRQIAKTSTDEAVYTRFTVQVADLHRKLRFQRVLVDSTGLGKPIVEHCKELGLPVAELNLGAKSKEELFSNLKILLEQKRVELPNNLDMLSNLNCILAERTRSGGYRFDHARGTHDDLGYALALAVYAARKNPVIIMNRSDPPEKRQSWRDGLGYSSN